MIGSPFGCHKKMTGGGTEKTSFNNAHQYHICKVSILTFGGFVTALCPSFPPMREWRDSGELMFLWRHDI